MNIEIIKPYQSSEQRIVTLGNITITLQEDEVNELFELLDNELHWKSTRENLTEEVNKLKEEIQDIYDSTDN